MLITLMGGSRSPVPDYDFTGGTLDGATLDRSSTATYLSDSTGFITDAAIDEARWERKSGTLCLMVEPQRTNLLTYSEDFTQRDFSTNTTITSNSDTGPDNTLTADTLAITSSVFYEYRSRAETDIGNDYALSFYGKSVGSFDPYLGVKSDPQGAVIAPESYLTDINQSTWSRVLRSFTANYTYEVTQFLIKGDPSIGSVILWGRMTEDITSSANHAASSYIRTGASTATRAQDQLTLAVPVGETTLQLTFDDDSTQNIDVTADAGATHTIDPDVLNRFHIKYGDFV